MNPIVSVIIPVYNLENAVSACLDSVLSQTYNNLQILVINDGSVDTTSEICSFYSQLDIRVTVVNIQNAGVSNARNLGLLATIGDYVMFIDGDDTVSEDWVESYVKNAVETNADIVFGGLTRIKDDKYEEMTIESGILNKGEMWKILCDVDTGFWIYGFIPNKIIKSNVLKENDILFDVTMIVQEDIDITIKILRVATKISRISTCGYYYSPSNTNRCCYIDLIKNKVNLLIEAMTYAILTNDEISTLQKAIKSTVITDLKGRTCFADFYKECCALSELFSQKNYTKYKNELMCFLLACNNRKILYFIVKMMKIPHNIKSYFMARVRSKSYVN